MQENTNAKEDINSNYMETRRIQKKTYSDGEVRYECQEKNPDGEWKTMLKYDNSMGRYTPAVFASGKLAESFMYRNPHVQKIEVYKVYEL